MERRWETGRTEAFSDGVFAIAITLLVLDIRIPETAFDDLWQAIIDQWPAYLGYATSFLTIGGFWLAHHGLFRRLQFVDDALMRLNLILLMVLSFLPFPTRLVAEAFHNAEAERAAVLFYGGCLLTASIVLAAMWRLVALRADSLLKPEVRESDLQTILRYSEPNVGFYVIASVVAIWAPRASAIMYLVIAVNLVVRAPSDHHPIAAIPED